MAPTLENAPSWHHSERLREICFAHLTFIFRCFFSLSAYVISMHLFVHARLYMHVSAEG